MENEINESKKIRFISLSFLWGCGVIILSDKGKESSAANIKGIAVSLSKTISASSRIDRDFGGGKLSKLFKMASFKVELL